MNLHIVPDNVFINKLYENLQELSVLADNRIVVRTNEPKLKFITHDLPYAQLYSPSFDNLCGKVEEYNRVFIHQFTPLLYRWVATHQFRELNWMVWGADLYNLPRIERRFYEPLTLRRYIKKNHSGRRLLYQLKVLVLHQRYREAAYRKVKNVLTWMTTEYDFARRELPGLAAKHQFFFYENQLPYQVLDKILQARPGTTEREVPTYILGNSASPELNHFDAVRYMHREGVRANLQVPVSYGDRTYVAFLKKNISFYKGGVIEFIDQYMNIEEYLNFLNQADGLIMNNIRPQGYGNIFMMMYLGKKVFLNERNLSIRDLDARGLLWLPLKDLKNESKKDFSENRTAILKLLSHETLLETYRQLFSSKKNRD